MSFAFTFMALAAAVPAIAAEDDAGSFLFGLNALFWTSIAVALS